MPSWWERLEAHIAFLWVLPTLSFRYIDVISHKCCSLVFLLIIPFITEFQRDTGETLAGSPLQRWFLLLHLEAGDSASEDFPEPFRGKRWMRSSQKAQWGSRAPGKLTPQTFPLQFSLSVYMLCFYVRKLIMEHSSTLHKRWTWGVYQLLGNRKKRISPRVGAEKSQGTWCLPAGKKFKTLKSPGK